MAPIGAWAMSRYVLREGRGRAAGDEVGLWHRLCSFALANVSILTAPSETTVGHWAMSWVRGEGAWHTRVPAICGITALRF